MHWGVRYLNRGRCESLLLSEFLAGLPAVAWVVAGSAFAKASADAPAFAWRFASSEGWSG